MLRRIAAGSPVLMLALGALACGRGADDTPQPGTAPGIQVTPDIVYGHRAGMALTLDVYRPAHHDGGAVIFINSGGFESGHLVQYVTAGWGRWRFSPPGELTLVGESDPIPLLDQFSFGDLLERGITVFDVRHSGSPCSALPGIAEDVARAVRFLQTNAGDLDIDPKRLGIWGASSGGYLALLTAFRGGDGGPDVEGRSEPPSAPLAAAAVYYPTGFDLAADADRFPDLIRNLPALQIEREALDRLSLKHFIGPDDPPVLIIYGEEDFPFITAPSESVAALLTRVGVECRVIRIAGTGHEFRGPDGYRPDHGDRARRVTAAWFREKLAAR